MEIEVNEYVRTDKGIIAKVYEIRLGTNREKKVFQNIYELDNGLWTVIDYIKKHSKNIIDLIEVGDYVNGERITDKWETRISSIKSNFSEEDIKTIVTHEQMVNVEYKVEEDK